MNEDAARALLDAADECAQAAAECSLDPMVADTWRDAAAMLRVARPDVPVSAGLLLIGLGAAAWTALVWWLGWVRGFNTRGPLRRVQEVPGIELRMRIGAIGDEPATTFWATSRQLHLMARYADPGSDGWMDLLTAQILPEAVELPRGPVGSPGGLRPTSSVPVRVEYRAHTERYDGDGFPFWGAVSRGCRARARR